MAKKWRSERNNLKGRVTVVFKPKSKEKKAWAKSYRSATTANKSISALKGKHKAVGKRPSKGFRFGAIVKRIGRNK